ncbi:SGNH/GDSL hydrolase family protein [Streptomyces sp. NPDC006668]|uniref:SGNH/GDSL hydrolase family protein n=1 Tax=Streptomyces sp. NPDC006668 TaxID=3156903 RepID=UPI00340AC8A9
MNYVALGDSYSSGVGAGDYEATDAGCKRSANAYSQRWIKEFSEEAVTNFTFVACSGATTADVESKQLSSLSAETTMVTMSIGGNDVGFAPVIAQCLVTNLYTDNLCIASTLAAGVRAQSSMPAKLDALYKKIRDRAPNARIFILGYPHIFQVGDCGAIGLSSLARAAINRSTSQLNEVIRKAATTNGFTFVDGEQTFAGRGVCSTAPGGAWLTDSSAGIDLYHPNRDGHEAYAVALDAAVRGF